MTTKKPSEKTKLMPWHWQRMRLIHLVYPYYYVLGQEKAGKSCLVSALLGDKFEGCIATRGADVDVCTVFASNWSSIDKAGIPEKLQKLFHTKLKVTAEVKISAKHVEALSTASNK